MWAAEIFTPADHSVAASLKAAGLLFSFIHSVLREQSQERSSVIPSVTRLLVPGSHFTAGFNICRKMTSQSLLFIKIQFTTFSLHSSTSHLRLSELQLKMDGWMSIQWRKPLPFLAICECGQSFVVKWFRLIYIVHEEYSLLLRCSN